MSSDREPEDDPVLEVSDLDVSYVSQGRTLRALDKVSLTARRGEIVGIVGESGCGKSTLSAALLGLLPENGRVAGGTANYRGHDLFGMTDGERRQLRGTDISMVFQDPLTNLNPTLKVGTQMMDVIRAHTQGRFDRASAREHIITMLERVGIPDAERRLSSFQHEFSGGQRQRILIAMALLLEPNLLIADEITSALDVTLEAQILRLLLDLRDERQTTVLLVTHDLGVVAQVCDRVVVMYAGRAVEEASVTGVFEHALHPYTQALLASVPSRHRKDLPGIPGRVPSLAELPDGCTFADRCPHAEPVCSAEPHPIHVGSRRVLCHAYDSSSGYRGDWVSTQAHSAKEGAS